MAAICGTIDDAAEHKPKSTPKSMYVNTQKAKKFADSDFQSQKIAKMCINLDDKIQQMYVNHQNCKKLLSNSIFVENILCLNVFLSKS